MLLLQKRKKAGAEDVYKRQGSENISLITLKSTLLRIFYGFQRFISQPAGKYLQDAGADAARSHIGAQFVNLSLIHI